MRESRRLSQCTADPTGQGGHRDPLRLVDDELGMTMLAKGMNHRR